MCCFDCIHLGTCEANRNGITKWVEPCKSCHLDPSYPSYKRKPLPRHYVMKNMSPEELKNELLGLAKVIANSKNLDADIMNWLKETI